MATSILKDSAYNQHSIPFSYYWLKTIGLSPWRENTNDLKDVRIKGKTLKCEFSFWGSLYSVVHVVAMLTINFYLVNSLFSLDPIIQNTSKIITLKLSCIAMVLGSVIPIINVFRQKLLINAYNLFDSLDDTLNRCSDYHVDNSNNNYLIIIASLLTTTGILVMKIMFYNSFTKVLIVSWPFYINCSLVFQYVKILKMIKLRLTAVNATLLKLGTANSKIFLSRESTYSDILTIKRAYIQICDMSEDIESFFGIQILIIIVICLVSAVFDLYYIILIIIDFQEVDLRLYQYGLVLFLSVFLLITLTSEVTEIVLQNEKTARILNLLIDRFLLDEKIKNKLVKFANELWHLKVNFSACDIAPLDRTLLGGFTGTVVSYLVIAVQFRVSAGSNKNTL